MSPHHRAALRASMRRQQYLVALLCCFIAAAHTDLVLGKKLKGMHAQQKHSLYCIISAYGAGHHNSPPGQIETHAYFPQFCHASMACSKHALCKHAGHAVTAKQARLKKEEAEKCTEENASACYDHTGNTGIGPVKVSVSSLKQQSVGRGHQRSTHVPFQPSACTALRLRG